MDERTRQISTWIAEALQRFPSVRRAVVFGSRATGRNSPKSDYDLAVDAPDASPAEWAALAAALDDAPTVLKVDLLRWEHAPLDLQEEIARDGIEVYGRKPSAA